ncbi:MAG: protein kinase [Anaerolineales bacterium]|nr:protein kinase [Anaerolineales bacterium]
MITEKFGRYEIKSEIARGGMATVFHAYDPSFERDVALKVLPQVFLHDPQFRTRFEREAKMIARLEHPAIVPVYDFGEEEGQPYIVMRYMSGGDLTERIESRTLSLAETAKIVNRIAQSLDAAHARNIVHRDLKPGNVLFDQYGNAFLSDFGIARMAEEAGPTLTGTSILGTPSYMSPEQVQGEKDLDGRSDIYALGVLVFQMLTGVMPYQGDTPAKVMMMHVLQPVPSILDFKPDLPTHCEALILKAMAKSPADRFATAGELSLALDSIARGEPLPSLFSTTDTVIAKGAPAVIPSGAGTQPASAAQTVLSRPRPGAVPAGPEIAEPPQAKKSSPIIPIVIFAALFLAVVGGLAFFGTQGKGPLAMLAPATATTQPSPTAVPATDTPPTSTTAPTAVENLPAVVTATEAPTEPPTEIPATPTETATPVPTAPIIGGADKIAWLDKNDIWIANLDGSELAQLTEDGTIKSGLQWAPDGQAVYYISGKCVQSVRLSDTRIDIITCFNYVDYLKSFEISPDGSTVAISLDNQLYLVPYDLQLLSEVKVRSDLTDLAECKDFAPYLKNFVKYAHWSKDGQFLAMVIFGVASDIGSADIVQVIPITQCTANPRAVDNFPPPRFRPAEYEKAPMIPSFAWDGLVLFAMHTVMRTNGYGDLYIYNMDLHKAQSKVNPVKNSCCYRDPYWSPDGTHLLISYQNWTDGPASPVSLYYIPYGTIGSGATYDPLPIPPITGDMANPQPILRIAQ